MQERTAVYPGRAIPGAKARTSADLLARFEAAGVPAGPVYDVLQMHADPQVRAREMVVEVEHARLGPVKTLGLPVKFSDTPGKVQTGAPLYGQHTREVLREHGFGDAEIEACAPKARAPLPTSEIGVLHPRADKPCEPGEGVESARRSFGRLYRTS